MKLPDAIERDLREIEAEYAQRGGQQAGTPRLRGLRASIEIELRRKRIAIAWLVRYTVNGEGCQELFSERWRAESFCDDAAMNQAGHGAKNLTLIPLYEG